MLGHLGAILGLCWAVLGHLAAMLGLCWAILGPSWAYVGPMLGQLGGYVGHSWRIGGRAWAYVGQMLGRLCGKHLQRQLFTIFFRPSKQKLWKNPHFLTSPWCNSAPPRGPKPCKKRWFLNTRSKIHCKLQR